MEKQKQNERELERQVRERFGTSVPKWREKTAKSGMKYEGRVYSKAEKAEMAALTDWLVGDAEYNRLFQAYFGYCSILESRGYGTERDHNPPGLDISIRHADILRNFAECTVEYIYHDMCCDPGTILGKGHADGYWIYLDRKYQDITHMQVGTAIINLDEVWAVVSGTLDEWLRRGLEREVFYQKNAVYPCDRCGKDMYEKTGSRFDPYENLLHCKSCAKDCTHFPTLDRKAGKR